VSEPAPRPSQARQRLFVGDVQGCADELESLLEQLRFDPDAHELWFVGDLVNRGPASARVLRLARELGGRSVLGNHDLHLLGVAAGERTLRTGDTLEDALGAPDRDALLDWLRSQPLLHGWDDLIVVHAGLHPRWSDPEAVTRPLEAAIRAGRIPWDDPDLRFATRVRHCDASGAQPPDDLHPGPGFAPWDAYYCGARTVVFGHWAARGLVRGPRTRGLDTGCVWGGALTAWIAEQDRFAQVPARRAYQTPDT
jgi:bis(5'-nucleosyl)-tetraphosphatase (symmetrical)